jgi:hypothetical protein
MANQSSGNACAEKSEVEGVNITREDVEVGRIRIKQKAMYYRVVTTFMEAFPPSCWEEVLNPS